MRRLPSIRLALLLALGPCPVPAPATPPPDPTTPPPTVVPGPGPENPPAAPAPFVRAALPAPGTTDDSLLVFRALPAGVVASIETSSDLRTWTPVGPPSASDGRPVASRIATHGATAGFARIRVD